MGIKNRRRKYKKLLEKERMLSDNYGNGRAARCLLNNCLLTQSQRIDPDTAKLEDLKIITCEDIKKAAQEILKSSSGIKSSEKYGLGFYKESNRIYQV
ncbi:MAG: lid domain [Thermosediminibacterales bacterium]|nr:lid domain [Thermosediminibacterales bacterium]MDK2836232.1 lid domain [Thermosediminibacterales bacterium]